jgi:hypothetical protein
MPGTPSAVPRSEPNGEAHTAAAGGCCGGVKRKAVINIEVVTCSFALERYAIATATMMRHVAGSHDGNANA